MPRHIELVTDKDWPSVKRLISESLQELEFYKYLEADAAKRKRFLDDYIESEYKDESNLFWCSKISFDGSSSDVGFRGRSSSLSDDDSSDIFMTGKLILPSGFVLNKLSPNCKDISSKRDAQNLLSPVGGLGKITCNKTTTREDKIKLYEKYPTAVDRLETYHLWYQRQAQDITNETERSFWQCCHIAVAPQYRKIGMAAKGMKEAIKAFSALAEVSGCQLVLVNTGVDTCRIVCKQAGFSDIITLFYHDRPRWMMSYIMNEEEQQENVNAITGKALKGL